MKKIIFISILIVSMSLNNVFAEKYTPSKDYDANDNFFVVSEVRNWKKNKKLTKKYNYDYWENHICKYFPNTNTESCSYYSIIVKKEDKSCSDYNNLIYIGKWKYIKKIDKNIRYVACQTDKLYGYFEIMDNINKNIQYMPLKLKYPVKAFTKDSEKINLIKWFDKYGYNAYVDLKTGEIKQAKE